MKKGARTPKSPLTPTITQFFKTKQPEEVHKQQSNPNSLSRSGLGNTKRVTMKYTRNNKESQIKRIKTHLVVDTSHVETLIQKSPAINNLFKQIGKIFCWPVQMFILKFLKGDTLKPWAEKYQPKAVDELLDRQVAEKVKKWIQTYTSYKNMGGVVDLEDSFLYDNSTSLRQQEIKTILFHERWQLKALVLLGREGVGKYSIIKCLTNTYNIKLHQCTHWENKVQYCKDLYQSIKSHSVQKLQKSSTKNTIKNYFKPQEISSGMCSKIHLIHEINQVIPQSKTLKFQESVVKFIEDSNVPVIITCSESQIPKMPQFLEYDVIEMKDLDIKDVSKFIWGIFHIEFHLSRFYKNEPIRAEQVDTVLLKSFQNVKFVEVITLEQMEKIISHLDLRIDSILTFFQQYLLQNKEPFINSPDIINSFLKYDKNQKLNQEIEILFKRQKQQVAHLSIQQQELIQCEFLRTKKEKAIDDLLNQSQKMNYCTPEQEEIDDESNTEKRRLRPISLESQHSFMMGLLAHRVSHKIGSSLKINEIQCLKLMQPKERRLRNRKKIDNQKVCLKKVLAKYLKKSDVLYLIKTGIES